MDCSALHDVDCIADDEAHRIHRVAIEVLPPAETIPEESTNKPSITLERDGLVRAQHDVLGNYQLAFKGNAKPLFTDNETNSERIHNYPIGQRFVKDAFHEYVVHGRHNAVNPQNIGTKFH